MRTRAHALGSRASWWKKPRKDVPATFNARGETVAEKPMFRFAFKRTRCIVPASGYSHCRRRTWMAAISTAAIDWAAANGFSILMGPHSSRADLIRKRRHYGEKLVAASHSDTDRTIPMARLIAIDETAVKAVR